MLYTGSIQQYFYTESSTMAPQDYLDMLLGKPAECGYKGQSNKNFPRLYF